MTIMGINTETNKTVVRVGIYFRLITPEFTEYFYQNFQREPNIVEFRLREWEFVPINFVPPARNLDLDNTTGKVLLPNVPQILQAVEENDGFRDAVVETICVFPESPNSSPYAFDLMIVRSCRDQGVEIEIELQSPFNAVGATFPSVFWTTGTSQEGLNIVGFVPEVPISPQVSLR